MPSSYNLPELVKKEIGALVKAGYYSSKSDVVKDALRTFLYSKRNLRMASAVELFKDGEVTLGKAAWKIGGVSLLVHLLSTSPVHGPLEFMFILLCIA